MSDNKITVLIADDEIEVQNVLRRFLIRRGYETILASTGREALGKARIQMPNAILLDVNMPEMDGFTVCRKLREEPATRLIPVLMVTAKGSVEDKVVGLHNGADDYLAKPFDLAELQARIETLLKRSERMIAANPLTHLPGSPSIQEEIEQRIRSGQTFGAAYIDIDNFKAYNDVYGYQQGDRVIQWTAHLIQDTIRKSGGNHQAQFLGHVGGDDFILVAESSVFKDLCQSIADDFDRDRTEWYNLMDRIRGTIETRDRQGSPHNYPLMALSIAVSTNENRKISHYGKVAEILAEVKSAVKNRANKEKSFVIFDRRRH